MHALDAVYGAGRTAPLLVGSIKTNIGHAEAAAGIAGLLKVVASLELGRLPRHLHFETLNPQIRISPDRIAVDAMEAEWRPVGGSRVAGVSRSEEHKSELQSLMRNSYAVFCLKKKQSKQQTKRENK